MQGLRVFRVAAAAMAVAMMAACGDGYVPTAPSFPQGGVGLAQPAQPDQPPPPAQPCSKGAPAFKASALLACDTLPIKGAQPKNHDQ